jgi:Skp family chaperone for outer membrane proteins
MSWLVALASVLCIVAGYAAVAASSQMKQPTVVVTFDIEKVIADLTERADAETKLRNLIIGIEETSVGKREAVVELEAEFESTTDADRQLVREEIDRLKLEAYSYQRFATEQIDIERSLMFRDLYQKIKETVAYLSEQNGYDLVLINDVGRELLINKNQKVSREQQVIAQIKVKRIVYSSDQIDITEQIVTHMNLEWEKNPSN